MVAKQSKTIKWLMHFARQSLNCSVFQKRKMIIYNVTIRIDLSAHDLWIRWMKEEHVPRVMETGCFTGNKVYRILAEDETEGISYAFQYFAESMSDYFNYKENFAPALQKELLDIFPGKFSAFRTLLKEV